MNWSDRFQAVDAFLLEHQALWRPRPFTLLQLPWEQQYPRLADWLRSRSLESAELSSAEIFRLGAPEPFPSLARLSMHLSRLDALPAKDIAAFNPRLSVDIPGRKWAQIRAFAGAVSFQSPPQHWLDWCAGKGHLGRILAQQGGTLTSLERDQQLVHDSHRLNCRHGLNAEPVCIDVMTDACDSLVRPQHTPVALHACGDLHVRLLQLACDTGCRQLALSPCCYNRTRHQRYRALSAAGRRSALTLSRHELSIPLQQTVTAGARVRRQRDRSMAWRLAFDLLQRRLRGTNDYLTTPSLGIEWFRKPFNDFCCDLAQLKNLPAPGHQNWEALELAGWQRLAAVRNLELLVSLFRRPLEVWLLLDRVMMLQERGYDVRLGTFCASETTPRNALILAELAAVK